MGRKVLQNCDLLFGKGPDLLAIDCQGSEQHIVFAKCDNEGASGAAQVHDGAAKRIALTVRLLVLLIQVVNEVLAGEQPPVCVSGPGLVHSLAEIGGERIRHASLRGAFKAFTVIRGHESECGLAQIQCVIEDRHEHRCEVAGRGVDDPQYFAGGRLLSHRLVAFGPAFRQLVLEIENHLLVLAISSNGLLTEFQVLRWSGSDRVSFDGGFIPFDAGAGTFRESRFCRP